MLSPTQYSTCSQELTSSNYMMVFGCLFYPETLTLNFQTTVNMSHPLFIAIVSLVIFLTAYGNREFIFGKFEGNVVFDYSKNSDILSQLGLSDQPSIKFQDKILHGRFLHITDLHPDGFYRVGSSYASKCHGKVVKNKSQQNHTASRYGDALSGCDSPIELMQSTLDWIKDNLLDKIDFVVWTGDNVRHDNDRDHPRLESQIFEMNQVVADLIHSTFLTDKDRENQENIIDNSSRDIKIIPSLGNNDVYPHNMFSPGPTLQIREFYRIWRNFVPEEQLHVFGRGAYFFVEVIKGKLAVLSFNTLYLYTANPLVDNCDSRKQPGYQLFRWLGVVLEEMRKRDMKIWLTGHVPPVPKNYDESCLRKYIIWTHEYRDVIIGGLYGHMNIDHWIPLDSEWAYNSLAAEVFPSESIPFDLYTGFPELDIKDADGMSHRYDGVPVGKVRYMNSVREDLYARIAESNDSGIFSDRYSIAHVSTSVIPTYNPGIRVWEYNITGLVDEDEKRAEIQRHPPWSTFFEDLEVEMAEDEETDEFAFPTKDPSLPVKMPSKTPLGPAYVSQTFSPLRYVQLFANLTAINSGQSPFQYELEYTTDDSPYQMNSLLVDDWIKLAWSKTRCLHG